MSRNMKIGELANITGITVRTLHYYDEIGLLKPIQTTESGHRLYGTQSITDLYRIISMKDMGFSLEEIKKLLLTKEVDVLELIDIQLLRVQDEISQKQLLLSRLLKLKQNLKENKELQIEDLKEMIPFINVSADKYFTNEQFEKLKSIHRNMKNDSDPGLEWFDFISKLENCYNRKSPKSDPVAQECSQFWNQMTHRLVGADELMQKSIQSFHASPESNSIKYGLTDELYQYLLTIL